MADALIPLITLDAPAKGTILGWRPGEPVPPRRAHVTAMQGASVHEVLVDRGYKQSGVGREHGRAMIEQYTELKSVCIPIPKE